MNATRRNFLSALGAGALSPLGAAPATKRPNFLFLFADDMGWADTGFNGRKEWTTPNLDRAAAQGTVFDRWYTAMPLCAPSRACLLTGKYTIHHTVRNNGTDIPKSEVTLAAALKPLGYRTALIGKWHRGRLPDGGFTHPLDRGFDSTFGYLDARHAWEHFPKTLWDGRNQVPVSGFSSDIIADRAINFLRENRNNPFYLYLPFIEPHFLIEAPEEDLALYRGKFKEKNPAEPYNARYAAMIHRLDKSIGRILKALDDNGQAENTVVVFTSDNGATFENGNQGTANYHDSNRPFRGQKRSLEEGGLRMPSFVRWPGQVPAGKRTSEVMHNIDVFPTLLAAAGGAPDPAWQVDGVNMLDVWRGKAPSPERTLFWEWQTETGDMYAAMRGEYKYLQLGNNRFLYNVVADPGERRTIFAEHPDIFKRLQGDLQAWIKSEVKPAR